MRVSTTNQAIEGYSIDEQVESLKAYAKAMSWEVHKVYKDAGYTGSNVDRPALKKMLSDAKFRAFDGVLVYKLDRLSRSVQDTLNLVKNEFNDKGVEFVSMKENIDTSTPMGNFFLTILSAIAEFERDQITERMRMGRIGRAKKGLPMTWTENYRPYGYNFGKNTHSPYEVNEQEASMIKILFDKYLSGLGIAELKKYMNSIDPNKKYSDRNIGRMLRNPIYIGKISYLGDIYDGLHEPIISEEIFNRTQSELEKRQVKAYEKSNSTRPFQSKYLVSGLMRCKFCGAPMQLHQYKPRKDGTRLKKYYCRDRSVWAANHYGTEKCDGGNEVLLDDIENIVLNAVQQIKLDPALFESNIKKIDTTPHYKKLEEIDDKLIRLIDLYVDGSISQAVFKNKQSELEYLKEEIKENIIELEEVDESQTVENLKVIDSFEVIHKLSYDTQKMICNKLIDRIEVGKNEINIIWNV